MGVDRSRALLERFGDRPFRVGEAEPAGVPRYELYRLRDRGELVNVSRGVFRRVGGAVSSSTDLATVCARVPRGIVCLNSALAYWDLSDELPAVVHVAVARGAHRPHIEVPATEVHVFAAATFTLERREERTETGELLSIYSPERAVVDATRLAHRAGRDTAFHALNRYVRRSGRAASPAARHRPRVGGTATIDRCPGSGDELSSTEADRINHELQRLAREHHGRNTQALSCSMRSRDFCVTREVTSRFLLQRAYKSR